jgi:rusticyanin
MNRKFLAVVIGVVGLGALGISAGVANGQDSASQATTTTTTTQVGPMYSYYRSMMGRLHTGSMMGVSVNSMMAEYSYDWMLGGARAPGWMDGATLPRFMMGTDTDPGVAMGSLFANAPGPRVSSSEATKLGNQTPRGAIVSTKNHRITFSGSTVHLVVLASPVNKDETFRAAGMVNPTIAVPKGARVSIEVINADPDMAQGFVVTNGTSASLRVPMMTTTRAFPGSALWFLGEPTSAGMHSGTITFTVSASGTYQYLCAVPGYARNGMFGKFLVIG